MEISSAYSSVQIAIAVHAQNQSGYAQGADGGEEYDVTAQAAPRPSINTSGEGVGYVVDDWAWSSAEFAARNLRKINVDISSIPFKAVAPPQGEGARDFSYFASVAASIDAPQAMTSWNDAAARDDAVTKNPSPAQVKYAVNQVNDAFIERGQNLYASLEKDKETGIHVVKLLDKNTKEIVRQYPSKEIVAVAAALTQYQESRGNLINISV